MLETVMLIIFIVVALCTLVCVYVKHVRKAYDDGWNEGTDYMRHRAVKFGYGKLIVLPDAENDNPVVQFEWINGEREYI